MNQADHQCCLCRQTFTLDSQPRMMPSCEHSSCTPCLKLHLSDPNTSIILCLHCGKEENLQEADLEYFPKNISLCKIIKEMQTSPIVTDKEKVPQSSPEVVVEQRVVVKCKAHNKQLEIVCLNDQVKLCPHCALFGQHKNHRLKTISEANQEMQQRKRIFQSQLQKKALIKQRYEGTQFKQMLVAKINTQKEKNIHDIRNRFASLYENIKLAEKQAFDDLSKCYKIIFKKISVLLKEEKRSQTKFKDWQHRCKRVIAEAQTKEKVEQRVALYFGGILEDRGEGDLLLLEMEDIMKEDQLLIQKLVSSVRITENREVGNSLFNFLEMQVEVEDIDLMVQAQQETIHPKHSTPQSSRMKVQFSSAESFDFMKSQPLWSPNNTISSRITQKHTTPNKNNSKDKLNKTSEKRRAGKSPQIFDANNQAVEKMVEDFCQRDNLQTLDLTAYSLSDTQIYDVLKYLRPFKRLKGLKLVKNNLTNEGLSRIVQFIPAVTSLNLSFNLLSEQALGVVLDSRQRLPLLRIINISNNKINERKAKSSVQELKRQGIIVTI